MQEVGTIKGVVAPWISDYYLSQNTVALIVLCSYKYASGQYFLN
jgi:hypothetical protein